MEPILKIDSLTKKFGNTVAVDGLSFEVCEGELFGFIGPNGAGKTTTIKIIAGLLRPDSGKVFVGGYDVQIYPQQAKRFIGYIPDSPYIYERLTGREFLQLVGSLYGMDRKTISERIEWLFSLFDVDGWGDDFAAEYSHGMRQKIIMASAILHDPKLIMIDEPMVGLDPQSQRLAKNIFKKLSQRGTAIFMSTHTLPLAEEICDRIAIIHKGKLEKIGTLEELRACAETSGLSLEELFVRITGGERDVKFWDE